MLAKFKTKNYSNRFFFEDRREIVAKKRNLKKRTIGKCVFLLVVRTAITDNDILLLQFSQSSLERTAESDSSKKRLKTKKKDGGGHLENTYCHGYLFDTNLVNDRKLMILGVWGARRFI
ncbi:hypothetical protein B9Z55_014365 [Caenorhabditis nigoni]|uniref:Uncharacterized protein n=1 Tax=Caenorhabditis nigoni TaxID=1611254 RepID=A0A2G5U5L3_9PELO|nr:hypothetical protein B9Z55_014365 [Caenorhabditis nigoni]